MGPALADLSLVFLHGFLGRPSDWEQIVLGLKASRTSFSTFSVDYFAIPRLSPENCFETWGCNFSEWVHNELGPGPHTLVGYSLGGRLALHALETSPDLFNIGVLISTNPGLSTEALASRSARIQNDQVWSTRFLNDSWEILVRDWNKQEVFNNSRTQPKSRHERDHQRHLLSKALVNWSLGRQKDFRPFLRNHPNQSITWIIGDQDSRARALHQDLVVNCPHLDCQVIEQAGHRVLWDAPDRLAQILDVVLGVHSKETKGSLE